jgi:glucose-6-phosphate isomerase
LREIVVETVNGALPRRRRHRHDTVTEGFAPMTYRQSIDGCLSSKIGDAGLREDRLAQWLTQRPVRVIDLPRLDEHALGALMMHFIMETIPAADLLSVDPFDQPALEAGRRLTREYLAG